MTHATWRKCDFQVHTPRDPNWTGARPLGVGDIVIGTGQPATVQDVEAARAEWAMSFVKKCVECGLQAIALTDHHEMFMVPYVQRAIASYKDENANFDLWLFPGMELTASGGRQCLILFDVDLSADWWSQAKGKLSIAYAGMDQTASRSPSVTQLACTYPDIKAELDSVPGLAGHFIVLPNASQGNSHTVLIDKAHADFKKMACVGAYLDSGQTIDTLGAKNRRRLSGQHNAWSDRCVYPIPTSDSRSHDFASLGTNNTWIKLAEPTTEAIRQAFLGHNSRICIEQPKLCSLFVSEFDVSGSSILEDTLLRLSAELNAVIGGRGSGKSSLIEYVAFALGRSCYDVERDHYTNTTRMRELIEETVIGQNAQISVVLVQDEAIFKIVRSPITSYQPQITYPNGTTQLLTAKELRTLFPAVVYSQGELAEIGKRAGQQTQLADLLQFVSSDYKREDDVLKSDTEVAKNTVRAALQTMVAHWDMQSQLRKLSTRRDSLSQRIGALEKTLPNLSDDDQKIVGHFDRANDFDSKRVQASRHSDEIFSKLSALKAETGIKRELGTTLSEKVIVDFQDHYTAMFDVFRDGLDELQKEVVARREAIKAAELVWAAEFKFARNARDQVLKKLGAHSAATTQIIKLREEATELTNQIGDLEANIAANDDPTGRLRESIEALRSLSTKRVECTLEWARQIEALSNGKIRASVEPQGDILEIQEALDAASAKTGSQEATRLRALENELRALTPVILLDKLRAECLALMYWRQVGEGFGEEMPAASTLFGLLGDREKLRFSFVERLNAARLEAISTALPRPMITLSYADGERQIAFEKASEGQRAAALLFMLLEQPGGPLIIDQPEGDLDNKIIADLTEKLHSAKQKRQLLFVSHNANIVVNGSSELVVHLDVDNSGKRRVEYSGAIEAEVICEVITSTMEGGEKAFKARQDKYGY